MNDDASVVTSETSEVNIEVTTHLCSPEYSADFLVVYYGPPRICLRKSFRPLTRLIRRPRGLYIFLFHRRSNRGLVNLIRKRCHLFVSTTPLFHRSRPFRPNVLQRTLTLSMTLTLRRLRSIHRNQTYSKRLPFSVTLMRKIILIPMRMTRSPIIRKNRIIRIVLSIRLISLTRSRIIRPTRLH